MWWGTAYPGQKGLVGPLEIDSLLTDVAQYLAEPLLVTVDGARRGRWAVMPGRPSVNRFVQGTSTNLPGTIGLTPAPNTQCRGLHGNFCAAAIHVTQTEYPDNNADDVRLTVLGPQLNSQTPIYIKMTRRDAFLLGTALQQVATGAVDQQAFSRAAEEYTLLFSEKWRRI